MKHKTLGKVTNNSDFDVLQRLMKKDVILSNLCSSMLN